MQIEAKVHFITFGCKVNRCETEGLKTVFKGAGWSVAEEEQGAEVFIINSCTVTGMTDRKLRQTIHRLKKQYPSCPLILIGCYPQAFPEEARALKVDGILGGKDREGLPELAEKLLNSRAEKAFKVTPYRTGDPFLPMQGGAAQDGTRGFLKIQDGCDRFCAYCIIPKARGRLRSSPPEQVVQEAEILVQAGHRELVLVGINLSCYGMEPGAGWNLAEAVERVYERCRGLGLRRIRLGSLEPEGLTPEILKRLRDVEGFCPHFHLSLQSGCNRTLKAMGRGYTAEEYRALTETIREVFAGKIPAVTTDIMTGFPGERQEDFLESLAFAESIGFAEAHVFPYSVRQGTRAALMPQLPMDLRRERGRIMGEAMKKSREDFLDGMTGRTVEVLFEREPDSCLYRGHTDNYVTVEAEKEPQAPTLRHQVKMVKILGHSNGVCRGVLAAEN